VVLVGGWFAYKFVSWSWRSLSQYWAVEALKRDTRELAEGESSITEIENVYKRFDGEILAKNNAAQMNVIGDTILTKRQSVSQFKGILEVDIKRVHKYINCLEALLIESRSVLERQELCQQIKGKSLPDARKVVQGLETLERAISLHGPYLELYVLAMSINLRKFFYLNRTDETAAYAYVVGAQEMAKDIKSLHEGLRNFLGAVDESKQDEKDRQLCKLADDLVKLLEQLLFNIQLGDGKKTYEKHLEVHRQVKNQQQYVELQKEQLRIQNQKVQNEEQLNQLKKQEIQVLREQNTIVKSQATAYVWLYASIVALRSKVDEHRDDKLAKKDVQKGISGLLKNMPVPKQQQGFVNKNVVECNLQ
jgi:hypothetical protein